MVRGKKRRRKEAEQNKGESEKLGSTIGYVTKLVYELRQVTTAWFQFFIFQAEDRERTEIDGL